MMKHLILNIKENNYQFFLELIKNFDFIEISENEGDSKEEIIQNLEKGFEELKLYKQGKLKTTAAKSFLNEL